MNPLSNEIASMTGVSATNVQPLGIRLRDNNDSGDNFETPPIVATTWELLAQIYDAFERRLDESLDELRVFEEITAGDGCLSEKSTELLANAVDLFREMREQMAIAEADLDESKGWWQSQLREAGGIAGATRYNPEYVHDCHRSMDQDSGKLLFQLDEQGRFLIEMGFISTDKLTSDQFFDCVLELPDDILRQCVYSTCQVLERMVDMEVERGLMKGLIVQADEGVNERIMAAQYYNERIVPYLSDGAASEWIARRRATGQDAAESLAIEGATDPAFTWSSSQHVFLCDVASKWCENFGFEDPFVGPTVFSHDSSDSEP